MHTALIWSISWLGTPSNSDSDNTDSVSRHAQVHSYTIRGIYGLHSCPCLKVAQHIYAYYQLHAAVMTS